MLIDAAIKRVIGKPDGQCYAASEAAYHLLGGKAAGYTPVVARVEASNSPWATHWWLRGPDGTIFDVTAGQFSYPFPYSTGRGSGFLTKNPSKKAQEIINAVKIQKGWEDLEGSALAGDEEG
jgi:hypothetical protein